VPEIVFCFISLFPRAIWDFEKVYVSFTSLCYAASGRKINLVIFSQAYNQHSVSKGDL